MRHFSTLVQFHHYPHDNPPLSNEDNAAKIWHMSLRSSSPSLPSFLAPKLFPSENCTKKRRIWPQVYPWRLRQKGVTFFRRQAHEGVGISQIEVKYERKGKSLCIYRDTKFYYCVKGDFFGNRESWCPKGLQVPRIQVPDCLSGGASQYGLLYGSTAPPPAPLARDMIAG